MTPLTPLVSLPDGLPIADDGTPRLGTWRGHAETTCLDAVVRARGISRARRLLMEKRWQWFCVMDDDHALGAALVRGGYMAQVFIWWFDRRARRMLLDTSASLPPWAVRVGDRPGRGRVAEAEVGADRLVIERGPAGTFIGGRWRGVELALEFGDQADPMLAVCPVHHGGAVNITQKQAGLHVTGTIRHQHREWTPGATPDTPALGFLDYTHGLLARETAWRWAIGAGALTDGRPVAFNVVAGFNDGLENALWLDGVPHALPDSDVVPPTNTQGAQWKTNDQQRHLDATLDAEGTRSERIDLKMVRSIYTQPLGSWRGTVLSVPIAKACGVAEDHVARW